MIFGAYAKNSEVTNLPVWFSVNKNDKKMTNTSNAQDSSEVNDHSITFMVLPSGKHLFPSKCLTWICYQKSVVVVDSYFCLV